MGALAIDVEGRDVEACLMAGILRVSGADAGVEMEGTTFDTGRQGRRGVQTPKLMPQRVKRT
jgi:hypothetical protein